MNRIWATVYNNNYHKSLDFRSFQVLFVPVFIFLFIFLQKRFYHKSLDFRSVQVLFVPVKQVRLYQSVKQIRLHQKSQS